MKRLFVLLALSLCVGSCTFSREVRVVSRGDHLALDFPWSFWRIVGLQDREYPCVDRVELFDEKRLLWTLDAASADDNCTDARMPITLGEPKRGYVAKGRFRLQSGRYGVAIRSYAPARVDFVLRADGSVRNITERTEVMAAPCGTYFGPIRCPQEGEAKVDPGSSPG